MYELDDIYCVDAYEAIKEIPDKSVDLIVTDPPYLIENTETGGHTQINHTMQKMLDELTDFDLCKGLDVKILDDFLRVLKVPNLYIWCNGKQIPMYLDYFVTQKGCAFDILIWNKTNAPPFLSNKYITDKEYLLYFRKGGYCCPPDYERGKTVYSQPMNVRDKDLFLHPTIKPLNIIENVITNSSREGELIFDPFMGSGTTAIAAKNLGRHFLGFEINPKWVQIAKNRLKKVDANGQIRFFLK